MKKTPKKTLTLMRTICQDSLRPAPEMLVSEWAEQYRLLDSSSALSGRWSNDVTPYLVGIMDEFCNPHTREIIFCKPTQVGGTVALQNILGYIISQKPSPTMVVYPVEKEAKTTLEPQIQGMIDTTPEIAKRFVLRKSSKLLKVFRGMKLYIRGANSPTSLASLAMQNVLMDELDKWVGASKKESGPIHLAEERVKTFASLGIAKIYKNSTPTLRSGPIWQAKENADVERHFFVPCPHCGEMRELEFGRMDFPSREVCPTNAERAAQVKYYCQECGASIEDRQKPGMLRGGEWREVARRIGKNQKPRKVAFWLNTLYSPFVSWEQIALEWLDAQGDAEKLQNFFNSWLALPWEDLDARTDADMVLERQTGLSPGQVPEWAQLLTAGIDVQRNGVYWTVRAWGAGLTSQNLEHGFAGNLVEAGDRINRPFFRQDGVAMQVSLCGVDSGDQTDDVYEFCAYNLDWAVPVKGSATLAHDHFRISKVDRAGNAAHGRLLLLVNGNKYKDMIAARMRRELGEGSWMVYAGCDRQYAEQVTAEQRVNEKRGGRSVQVWRPKGSHADNHYLDTEVYAFAIADYLGVRSLLPIDPLVAPDVPPVKQIQESGWIHYDGQWLP